MRCGRQKKKNTGIMKPKEDVRMRGHAKEINKGHAKEIN